MYKIGDIYKETVLIFNGFDNTGKATYKKGIVEWKIIKVFEYAVLCENTKGEHKMFQI